MKKSLFQYAVLRHWVDDDGEEQTSLAVPVTTVLAGSEESATTEAARNIPREIDADELEIVVVPFE